MQAFTASCMLHSSKQHAESPSQGMRARHESAGMTLEQAAGAGNHYGTPINMLPKDEGWGGGGGGEAAGNALHASGVSVPAH